MTYRGLGLKVSQDPQGKLPCTSVLCVWAAAESDADS